MKPKRISLAYELAEIRDALEAVRVLCDGIRNEQSCTARDELRRPRRYRQRKRRQS